MLHVGISVSEMGQVAEEDLMEDKEEFAKAKGNLAEEEITQAGKMKNKFQRNVEGTDVLLAQYLMKTQSSGIPTQRK